ncbi:hypothetical protein [Actinomadura sp. HBU206391]|uniref:hypothetical protein n=1 Tax=Actinomadura sp. HBU206391 TaxID=2731692 RepID=UPI001650A708|nr:hypothetical protein [Actinomadura sp. HBU206391]MBC6457195.1 hypothetical protein [Actinomadura sp. HBU206391]
MTWISELEEEEQTLERLIAEKMQVDSGSLRLSVSSLKRRLEEVRARLSSATRPQLEIRLVGTAINDHEVRLELLGPFLEELQQTVSSIGQALRGSATAASSIPKEVRDQTALSYNASGPGSVVLYLRAPSDPRVAEEIPYPELLDERTKPLAVAAIERLLALAQHARSGTPDDSLVDDVYPLGPRTYKHLNSLVRLISDSETDAEFTLSAPIEGELNASLDAVAARRIHDVLKQTRVAEEFQEIVGELRGVSSIRNAFEVITPEGRVITGKVREDLVPSLRNWYEKPVIASLEVTVSRSLTTGLERRRHLLTGLADARPYDVGSGV